MGTTLQRQTRLDGEFDRLYQGGLKHADFRILFETKLQEMKESGMEMLGEETLYREYLAELDSDYRIPLMHMDWKIAGPGMPARKPKNYKEIGRAVGLLVEER